MLRPIPIAPLLLSLLSIEARAQAHPHPDAKSVAPAIGLSVANTAIPLAVGASRLDDSINFLIFYSCVVGPFPGLAYAGAVERGLEGVGLRLVTLGTAVTIAVESFQFGKDSGGGNDALLLIAGGVTAVSWLADMAAIPSIVRRHNESLTISPMVGSNGQVGARIQVRW